MKCVLFLPIMVIALSACSGAVVPGLGVNAVKEQLKAPSTAKFPEANIVWNEGELYLIDVTVDAQNSFGATMRSKFCVCAEYKGWTGGSRTSVYPEGSCLDGLNANTVSSNDAYAKGCKSRMGIR